ncbi:hypothetical protein RRG08_016375 [Elysia crispata]|uniref:Uncharacterized protein n=1 Tax=Elysia crispata TaxID=231223 RepID=A0AAE1DXC2_9GAST|nr:hypothetical protein RRG08_016375 [Elysia crispata]
MIFLRCFVNTFTRGEYNLQECATKASERAGPAPVYLPNFREPRLVITASSQGSSLTIRMSYVSMSDSTE